MALFITFLVIALAPPTALAKDEFPVVKINTTQGDIYVELRPDKAPKTVANFLRYVEEGHYNGTLFHRVMIDFMIQGGGFDLLFEEKPTHDPIELESANGLKNKRGTIAMARTSEPNSATSQFFINVKKHNKELNYQKKKKGGEGYAVFGKVIRGMTVVDNISRLKVGPGGHFETHVTKPLVAIEEITIVPPKEED